MTNVIRERSCRWVGLGAVALTALTSPASAQGAVHAGAPGAKGGDLAGFDFAFHTDFGGDSLTGNPGGRALAEGHVTFPTKRKFVLDLWRLTDQCNAQGTNDGYRAELDVGVHLRYDGGQVGVGGYTVYYKGPCDGGFSYFYDHAWEAPSDAVITGVKFFLVEITDAGRFSPSPKDQASSRTIDNPKT
jgi:hypothetical protein